MLPMADGVNVAEDPFTIVKSVIGTQPKKSLVGVAVKFATELTQSGLTSLVMFTVGKGLT